MSLLFGTAGVPISAANRSTESGIRRVKELDLKAMEVEFVQGVRMKEEKAAKVREVAIASQIRLSCHGPYWINFNSREAEKITASRERLIHAASIAKILGAGSVVFHPAFYHDDAPELVLTRVVQELMLVREQLDLAGNDVILRPETTGKGSQFGSLEETVQMARAVPGVLPCIDFGHLYARTQGQINGYDAFSRVLDYTAESLGARWNKNVHLHISGVEYGLKGEKRHLALKDSDFKYEELLKACLNFELEGLAICESPVLEQDALLLQRTYLALT